MSLVACALGGYAVLMALAQVRLIPVYRRLSFTPGASSFAFAFASKSERNTNTKASIFEGIFLNLGALCSHQVIHSFLVYNTIFAMSEIPKKQNLQTAP